MLALTHCLQSLWIMWVLDVSQALSSHAVGPQLLCFPLLMPCHWQSAPVSGDLQPLPCLADFLLLHMLFVFKENCKFFQVTELVEQICLLCAGAKVLLSPALFCFQCNNIFVKEQSSAKKMKGCRGRVETDLCWWSFQELLSFYLHPASVPPVPPVGLLPPLEGWKEPSKGLLGLINFVPGSMCFT